ncbi:MAG: DUF2793 domain-containing protein [Alphaproteobacteria bacterium]
MPETPNLGLPLIVAQQAMKHVTHYEALIRLDTLVQLSVLQMSVVVPPASPKSGDRYLIGSNPTGAFSNFAGTIAYYDGASWRYSMPLAGWILFNVSDGYFYFYDGTIWKKLFDTLTQVQNLLSLGVGTTSDSINRLSVKTNGALFSSLGSNEGGSGDVRFTINRESASKTASQLYQTNWSGRAETGLMGDDNWRLKLSANGSTWSDALVGYSTSGAIRIDQLLSGRSQAANNGRFESDFDGTMNSAAVFTDTSSAASALAINFRKAGSTVGSIRLSSTGTNFLTTSDYRLKTNVTDLDQALTRLKKLKPRRFSFLSDPEHEVDGFLAHEVHDAVPEAVFGFKDAVDENSQIVPQTIDATRLIPLLVAALLELTARVEALETQHP